MACSVDQASTGAHGLSNSPQHHIFYSHPFDVPDECGGCRPGAVREAGEKSSTTLPASYINGFIGLLFTFLVYFAFLLIFVFRDRSKGSHRCNSQLICVTLTIQVTNNALERTNDHLINTKRVLEEEKLQREALLGRQVRLFEGRGDE